MGGRDFTGEDLTEHDLEQTNLTRAIFTGATLKDLKHTNLTDAVFKDAKVKGSMEGATVGAFKPPSKRPPAQPQSWFGMLKRLLGGEVIQGLVSEVGAEIAEELDLEAGMAEVSEVSEDAAGDIEAAYEHVGAKAAAMLKWLRETRDAMETQHRTVLEALDTAEKVSNKVLSLSTKPKDRKNLTAVSTEVSLAGAHQSGQIVAVQVEEGAHYLANRC